MITLNLDQDDCASLVAVLEEDNWDQPDCLCFRCALSAVVRKKTGMITRQQHLENIRADEKARGLNSHIVPHDPNRKPGISYAGVETLTAEQLARLYQP